MNEFSKDELNYYQRQISLPEIGISGQQKLAESSVLVVGAGGLASPVLTYLATAGVGLIACIDDDTVDISNLHRQPIHRFSNIGRFKTESALETLTNLNPKIRTEFYQEKLTSENGLKIAEKYDLIIDCSDNFPTRYLVNDVAVLSNKLVIFASIHQFEGQVSVFASKNGPCYRCIFPNPPRPGQIPDCAEAGVFGVLPAVIGSIQATEAIKLLIHIGDPLIGRLLNYDAKSMRFSEFKVSKNVNCQLCGEKPSQQGLIDYDAFCGIRQSDSISVDVFLNTFQNRTDVQLIDIRETDELKRNPLSNWNHIPLQKFIDNKSEFNKTETYIFICHSGIRSLKLVEILKDSGFHSVYSLAGGVLKLQNQVLR